MPHTTSASKSSKRAQQDTRSEPSAGPHGATLAPPDYGIDFVDQPSADQSPIQRQAATAGERVVTDGGDRPNHTGLPDNLKDGIESLSGLDMSDVRVHFNSSKPAQLQALAYTQGTDIHIATGQERHLRHEAWHVAQQKQGRARPTLKANGVQINDDQGLEHEADTMGVKAEGMASFPIPTRIFQDRSGRSANSTLHGHGEHARGAMRTPLHGVNFIDRQSPPIIQRQILDPAYEDDVFDISHGKRGAELADMRHGKVSASDPRVAVLNQFLTSSAVKGNRSYPAPLTRRPTPPSKLEEAILESPKSEIDEPKTAEPKPVETEPAKVEPAKAAPEKAEPTVGKKKRKNKTKGVSQPSKAPSTQPSVDTSKMSVDELMAAMGLADEKPGKQTPAKKKNTKKEEELKPKKLTLEQQRKLEKEKAFEEREKERRLERLVEEAQREKVRQNLNNALPGQKEELRQQAVALRLERDKYPARASCTHAQRLKRDGYDGMATKVDEGVTELEDAIQRKQSITLDELHQLTTRMVTLKLAAERYEPPLTETEKDEHQVDRLVDYFNKAKANEADWVHSMGGSKRGPSYPDIVRKGVYRKIRNRLANTTHAMPAWRTKFESPIPDANGTLTCLITPPTFKGRDASREFNITLRDSLGEEVSTRLNLHINIEKADHY